MDLTIVGCSGSVSGPTSPASSYLVQTPYEGRTFSLVLDLGPGAFGALYRYLDPKEVDAIGLSHLHPDHCLDICAYYVAARYSPSAPWPRRPLYAPAGAAQRLSRAYDVAPATGSPEEGGPGIGGHFDHHAWSAEHRIGPFDVSTVRVDHPVETYAIRVRERDGARQSLVFSGDTGPCDAMVGLASGVDLLLVEAAFADHPGNPPGVHLSARQAAEAGAAAGVGHIVLTHIPPWYDPAGMLAEARAVTDIPVSLAQAGAHRPVG